MRQGSFSCNVIVLSLQIVRFQDQLVLFRLIHTEIVQKLAALGDFSEESAASGVILLVLLKVAREFADFFRQNSDLNLRRAGVFLMKLCIRDQLLLGAARKCHGACGGRKNVSKKSARRAVWAKLRQIARTGTNCTGSLKKGKSKRVDNRSPGA
jgi:hypothetical protein